MPAQINCGIIVTIINNAIFSCHPLGVSPTGDVSQVRIEFSASFLGLEANAQIQALYNLAQAHSTARDGNEIFVHTVAQSLADSLGAGQIDAAALQQGIEAEFAA